MLRHVLPLLVGSLAACGARTALEDFGASSEGGAGGAPLTSASTSASSASSSGAVGGASSSSSGSGGARFACLSITGAPTRVAFDAGLAVGSPKLVVPAGSTTSVALVAGLAPPLPPLGVPAEVAVTRVDPWGDWPPAIAPLTPLATIRPSRFEIASSTDDDAFALLVDLFDSPTAAGGLAAATDARTDGTATFTSLSTEHQEPLFVVTTDDGIAFGSQRIDAQGAASSHVEAFGQVEDRASCGAPPLAGAALSFGDHLLYSLSTQDTSGGCTSSPPAADARRLAIGRASAAGFVQTEAYGPFFSSYGAVSALQWLPKSMGGWFFERTAAMGIPESSIVEGSIPDDGTADLPLETIPVVGVDGLAMASWRGGDMFGVSDAGSGPDVVRAFVYHRGFPEQSDYVDLTPAGQILGEFAAVADATEKQWLIAWTERAADGTFSLWVARIACDA